MLGRYVRLMHAYWVHHRDGSVSSLLLFSYSLAVYCTMLDLPWTVLD
jgi:hypothetical protein